MLEEILIFLKIFVLITCAIYAVFQTGKALAALAHTLKRTPLCDSCKNLATKRPKSWKYWQYHCKFRNEGYDVPPIICCEYKKKDPPEVNP